MKAIIVSISFVVIVQLIGQLIPLSNVFFGTPVLVPLGVCTICFFNISANRVTTFRIIVVYFCVFLSFILNYLYAPGTRDAAGAAIVLISSFVSPLVAAIIMVVTKLADCRNRMLHKADLAEFFLIIAIPTVWMLLNRFGHSNLLLKILD